MKYSIQYSYITKQMRKMHYCYNNRYNYNFHDIWSIHSTLGNSNCTFGGFHEHQIIPYSTLLSRSKKFANISLQKLTLVYSDSYFVAMKRLFSYQYSFVSTKRLILVKCLYTYQSMYW